MSILWRRDPESNRTDRICNPGHNRFAIAPQNPGRDSVETGFGVSDSDKKWKPELPSFEYLERETRLELATSTLARLRSTN
jgi:hypothetical protein